MIMEPTAATSVETFFLGQYEVPRLFNGLWQLSSNSWGTASDLKIRRQMAACADKGFTAFADHYGDAEILFGKFRQEREQPESIFGATKWCVFKNIDPTRQLVEGAVNERLRRMKLSHVDLLQFHWNNYDDKRYITAMRHLKDLQVEGKIALLGLCNFNSAIMEELCTELGPGIIVTNQVQFSLIDIRPLHAMAEVCERQNVKLLTYGSLCGGFLSDKWIGKEEPDPYAGCLNPSQRKYLDMIIKAWGSWSLFQELLSVLRSIADKYEEKSVANVAIRWVLDQPFVGAILVGTRMGVSEHMDDNCKAYGWRLVAEDNAAIDVVLAQSKGSQLIKLIGDCGAEYRQPESSL